MTSIAISRLHWRSTLVAMAVMAVDTLLSGLVTQGQVSAGAATSLRAQINQAYAAVAEPNSYKPLEFRRALGGAVRTIRSLQ